MSSQYRTSAPLEQERKEISQQLTHQLENFVQPLLTWLDACVDRRLVRTFLLSLAAILTFRNRTFGLCLSELGSYLLEGVQATAGTKRLSRLLHSTRWGKGLIERFLWEQADKAVQEMHQVGEEVLCAWDGSVIEKPESEHTPGLCAVRSSKAKRLQKPRKGNWNQQKGKAITVFGLEWTALLVLGMQRLPVVAAMRWWSRKGEEATKQQEVEKHLLIQVATRWGNSVLPIFDRGYASKSWIALLNMLHLRFVIRWKKGHIFLTEDGQEKKVWEMARGKKSWQQREVWDERKKCWVKMGVLAIPVRHAGYAGPLWLVVGRRKGEPWYLITNEPIQTVEEAWHLIFVYARRWQIELSFRYGKSEMALESCRVRTTEAREKLLLLVTLVYAYLLSLLEPTKEALKTWLLQHYCHRTGKRVKKAKIPLYRLRWAISRLWMKYPPAFANALLKTLPEASNTYSKTSG